MFPYDSDEYLKGPNGQIPDQAILDRVRQGVRFVERGISIRDRIACKRFIDGSEAGVDIQHDDFYVDMAGVLPSSFEVGNTNYLQINVLTKVAAIAIGDPDWHVEHIDPAMPELVRRFLKALWKDRHWARVCRTALLKRSISGMGAVAYLWDESRGPIIEHVRVKDLSVDPNVVDWHNLRWGARRIRLPREEAKRRWPTAELDATHADIPNMDETSAEPSESVEMWVYWDADTEAVLYGSDVLQRGPNLYGRVPLIFLEGDIAPESYFSLGDYDIAVGIQMEIARLDSIINNAAENGGAIGWYNPALLDDAAKEAFSKGRPEGFVGISAPAGGNEAFGYISAEPLSQNMMEARRLAQQGLDAATGVSEYQRGVINQSVKFATEAAMLANQSGSKGLQARVEYEQFIDEIVKALIRMLIKFGPSLMQVGDPNDLLLFQALSGIQDICVIESSTAYKDPAYEIQSSLQFAQAVMPFIQMGIIDPVAVAMRVVRAFGERDPNKYIKPQQQPGMPPGSMGPGPAGMAPPGIGQSGALPGQAMPPGMPAQPPPQPVPLMAMRQGMARG